jgi:Holliday junction DNA helicase RuvA
MYHHISGTLSHKLPGMAVIEAAGVGYELFISLATYQALPEPKKPVSLLTHLNVKEDALTLYGFASEAERKFFRQLTEHVKGVGPKVALAILSGGPLERIQQAIRLGDVATLKAIKGVGDATAKRIVLELGKILVKESVGEETDSVRGAKKTAAAVGSALSLAQLDAMSELAVKAVMQLNEVSQEVALSAVQQALELLRNAGTPPQHVQDLIRRAITLTD